MTTDSGASAAWHNPDPAFRYGYDIAGTPRFMGRAWEDAEADVRAGYADWSRHHGYAPDTPWSEVRERVRNGWHAAGGH